MLGEQDDVEQFLFMLRKKGDCKCENKILVQIHVYENYRIGDFIIV